MGSRRLKDDPLHLIQNDPTPVGIGGDTLNNNLYQTALKRSIRGQYTDSTNVKSAYIQLYPDSAEREMRRISNASMNIVAKELKACLPEIMKAYERETRNDSRMDGLSDLRSKVKSVFGRSQERIEKAIDKSNLDKRITNAANMVQKTVVREWKKTIQKTLGVDVLDEYYKDELYHETVAEWASEGEDRLRAVPATLLDRLKEIIDDGYKKRRPISEIKRRIQEAYSSAKRVAAANAAGSVSALNYECTKVTQEDAGVKEYSWYTRRDFRVRPCHASFDGKIFRWDGPPEIWYETKHEGRVYTGRFCHPGQDYHCRCRAVPVFDVNSLSLPVSDPTTEW